jgi:NAD(P)-dependent dehydrogenase (short-subunit alcohol dehydrogenase family)
MLLELAKHNPKHIAFTGRNSENAALVVKAVKAINDSIVVTFISCDQSSLKSVQAAVHQFLSISDRLDIFVGNAGICVGAQPPSLTKDGYEIIFGVNYIAHALFVKLLLPTMLATASLPGADVRIVLLASSAHMLAPSGSIDFDSLSKSDDGRHLGEWKRYGQSKLANAAFAAELAQRFPQITSVAVHPGVVTTDMWTDMSMPDKTLVWFGNGGKILTPEKGILNHLWAATTDKGEITNGAYYKPVGKKGIPIRGVGDKRLAATLWTWTEKELQQYESLEPELGLDLNEEKQQPPSYSAVMTES